MDSRCKDHTVSRSSLFFIMEILIPGKTVFILRRGPACLPLQQWRTTTRAMPWIPTLHRPTTSPRATHLQDRATRPQDSHPLAAALTGPHPTAATSSSSQDRMRASPGSWTPTWCCPASCTGAATVSSGASPLGWRVSRCRQLPG